jgi:predicted hydrocarbon binding protein
MDERKTSNYEMRTWLETIQNIVGENGLKSILNHSGLTHYIDKLPPEDYEFVIPKKDIVSLFGSLNALFGKRGIRSLQLRIGREFTRVSIEKYNPLMAKTLVTAAKFVPQNMKIRLALQRFSEELGSALSLDIDVQEDDQYFTVSIKGLFISDGVAADAPVCHAYVGILEYLVEWITGHDHEVREIQCVAMGDDTDVFQISKVRRD